MDNWFLVLNFGAFLGLLFGIWIKLYEIHKTLKEIAAKLGQS